MRIVFAGSPAFAVPGLEGLLASDHEIACVVTQPDRPAGRGLGLKAPPVKERALRAGIVVHQPEKFNTGSFRATLEELKPDLMAVVAYGKIFRRKALELPRLGCVNLHASLLPTYRGVAPANWAIMNGETETGVTTILMDEGVDTGDMILKAATPIDPDETAGDLLARLAELGAGILRDTCDLIASGRFPRESQDENLASYAPKLAKDDGRIDWRQPARDVHNRIRGVTPWPSAFTMQGERRVKILRSSLGEGGGAVPGEVIAVEPTGGILVSCGEGAVWLQELQAQGKRPVAGADFARGYRITVGDRFSYETERDSQG